MSELTIKQIDVRRNVSRETIESLTGQPLPRREKPYPFTLAELKVLEARVDELNKTKAVKATARSKK